MVYTIYTMIIPYDQAISCDLLTWLLKSSSFMTLKLVETGLGNCPILGILDITL